MLSSSVVEFHVDCKLQVSVASLLAPALPLFSNLKKLEASWDAHGLGRSHLSCLQHCPLLEILNVTYYGRHIDLGPNFPEGEGPDSLVQLFKVGTVLSLSLSLYVCVCVILCVWVCVYVCACARMQGCGVHACLRLCVYVQAHARVGDGACLLLLLGISA